MSFVKLPDTAGFDDQRDLLVLSLRHSTNLYLPKFSDEPLTVRSADPAVASIAGAVDLTEAQKKAALPEGLYKKQNPFDPKIADSRFGGVGPSAALKWFGMKKIVVKAESLGETELVMQRPDTTPWQDPTRVVVVSNLANRQVDSSGTTPAFRRELHAMSLRNAVVRVAQDQANCCFANDTSGDGRYGLPAGLFDLKGNAVTDWCGAFVYWCYRRASAIKGMTNPLGPINDVVLSPQKAIGWAIANPASATVLRYQGPALYQWGAKRALATQCQTVDAIPGSNLFTGDICLLRNENNWQHVCLIYDPGDGDSFMTLDGNQGTPSMKVVKRNWNARLGNGSYSYVFVHLNLP